MTTIDDAQKASVMVCELLLHFGIGYGAQSQVDTPNSNFPNPFKPAIAGGELTAFHETLFNNALQLINSWNAGDMRANAINAAFWHGVYARQRVVESGGRLTAHMIDITLEKAQKNHCPQFSDDSEVLDGFICRRGKKPLPV